MSFQPAWGCVPQAFPLTGVAYGDAVDSRPLRTGLNGRDGVL